MGKASRIKGQRAAERTVTHEPAVPINWPDGHIGVEQTGDDEGECIVVTIHGTRHYLHSTTAQALSQKLEEQIVDWDEHAKANGAIGVLPGRSARSGNESQQFKSRTVAAELSRARELTKVMVRGALESLSYDGALTQDHLPFLGFVERAQAFHQGTLEMVEQGNPLAAATLLRSFAENLAVVYYIEKNPSEFDKLRPGAEQDLPMGKVVAAAQQNLPGFKDLYKRLSAMAHPSGAGAFQTLDVGEDGHFTWQSSPTFRSPDEARTILRWLEEIRELTGRVIQETAKQFDAAARARETTVS